MFTELVEAIVQEAERTAAELVGERDDAGPLRCAGAGAAHQEESPCAKERGGDDDATTNAGVVADVGNATEPVERRSYRAAQRLALVVWLAEQRAHAAASCTDPEVLLVPHHFV